MNLKFDATHIVLDDYKLAAYICLRKRFYHLWIQQRLGEHFSLQQSDISSCQEIENQEKGMLIHLESIY